MAEESALGSTSDLKAMRTVFMGSNIIFWILSVVIIIRLFMIKGELEKLNRTVQSVMAVASSPNLDGYEIVVPGATEDDDKVAYKFRRVMMPEEMMDATGDMPDAPPPPTEAPAPEEK